MESLLLEHYEAMDELQQTIDLAEKEVLAAEKFLAEKRAELARLKREHGIEDEPSRGWDPLPMACCHCGSSVNPFCPCPECGNDPMPF